MPFSVCLITDVFSAFTTKGVFALIHLLLNIYERKDGGLMKPFITFPVIFLLTYFVNRLSYVDFIIFFLSKHSANYLPFFTTI